MRSVSSKFVTTIEVIDPDTGNKCEVEIRKLASGALVGLDAAYLHQLEKGEHPLSPYDDEMTIYIPDEEMDSTELAEQQRQFDKFSPPKE